MAKGHVAQGPGKSAQKMCTHDGFAKMNIVALNATRELR